MASFGEDLESLLNATEELGRRRAAYWAPLNFEPLLDWQEQTFSMLRKGDGRKAVEKAWMALSEAMETAKQAELLHTELNAMLAFQHSLLDRINKEPEPEPETPRGTLPDFWRRLPGLIKKGIGMSKTFLESLKDVLTDEDLLKNNVLPGPWRIVLEGAIEVADTLKT